MFTPKYSTFYNEGNLFDPHPKRNQFRMETSGCFEYRSRAIFRWRRRQAPLVRWQGCQQLCPLGAASEISITHGEWDQLWFDWQKALRQMFAGKNLLTIEAFTGRVPPSSPSPSSPWVITFTAFCNFGNCFLSSDIDALFLYGSWTFMEPTVCWRGGRGGQ